MSTPIPKCTLTDRELWETNPPVSGRPFAAVAPYMFDHMRAMVDRTIEVMVARGDLIVPDRPNHLFTQRNRND